MPELQQYIYLGYQHKIEVILRIDKSYEPRKSLSCEIYSEFFAYFASLFFFTKQHIKIFFMSYFANNIFINLILLLPITFLLFYLLDHKIENFRIIVIIKQIFISEKIIIRKVIYFNLIN